MKYITTYVHGSSNMSLYVHMSLPAVSLSIHIQEGRSIVILSVVVMRWHLTYTELTCTHTEVIGSIESSRSINAIRHFLVSQQRAPDMSIKVNYIVVQAAALMNVE